MRAMPSKTHLTIATIIALSSLIGVRLRAQSPKDPWQKISVPTAAGFRGLSAATAGIVWASGTEGTIIRTMNGGATWSVHTVPGAEKLDFRGIHAFDANTAVIMSSGNAEDGQARIYRTTDGGENWKLVYEQKTRGIFFDAIAFWDREHGIVVSDPVEGHFALFITTDGGATWKQIPPENIPAALPNEGAFAASNSCLTVEGGNNVWFVTGGANVARVFRSNDRGKSWKVAEAPLRPPNASSGLFSVAFADARNGIAVGGDYAHPTGSQSPVVFLTNDGGATWRTGSPTDPPGLFLSSVTYKPGAHAAKSKTERAIAADSAEPAAAGTGGINSIGASGKWVRESEQDINAIAFPTHDAGWAVGPKGAVLHRNK
jgi:photosystem II stability/assembly factor-like uncharacterized protein